MWDVTKFSLFQMLVAIGAAWAIYTFAIDKESPIVVKNNWQLAVGGMLSVSYLFGILAILILARLRTYFVIVTRYINEQRGFFLNSKPLGFANASGFYTDPNLPKAFNPLSTHMLTTAVIALICSF
ncbi:MAG: hypothetical protein O7F13_04985, partial [Gammaproteobacteria bacterium]|nr:hypothetical protein [Gammaproteobacteria bacterium]